MTTARRCPARSRPSLSGQDFAKLLMDGWVPAGIALGISVAGLHDTMLTTSSGPWGTGNAEVPAYTDLMVYVRQDAWSRLQQTTRGLGAGSCYPPASRSARGLAGSHPARHQGLLIEVIARADPVVAVSDPQGDPLDQQHGRQFPSGLDLLEVGCDLRVIGA
jgi:hypothetical protein